MIKLKTKNNDGNLHFSHREVRVRPAPIKGILFFFFFFFFSQQHELELMRVSTLKFRGEGVSTYCMYVYQ